MNVQLRHEHGTQYRAIIATPQGPLVARITALDGWVFSGAIFLPDGKSIGIDDRPVFGRAIRRAFARREEILRERADISVERARRAGRRARPRICDLRMPNEVTA